MVLSMLNLIGDQFELFNSVGVAHMKDIPCLNALINNNVIDIGHNGKKARAGKHNYSQKVAGI